MDLRHLRIQANIKQKDAAAYFGLSSRMYQNYEDNPRYYGTLKYRYMLEKLMLKSPILDDSILSIEDISQKCKVIFSKYQIQYCYLLFDDTTHNTIPEKPIELLIKGIFQPFDLLFIKNELIAALNRHIKIYSDIKYIDEAIIEEMLLNGIKIYNLEQARYDQDGLPINQEYLEKDLPAFIQKDIDALLEGLKQNVTHLDCLWCELSGSINSALNAFMITAEQAAYLRKKFLGEIDGF